MPPSIDIVEGLDALRNILPYLDKGFRYAIEVRHRSWFQDLASGVKFSIVAANNHYAGFGPGTVNIFRQLLGLEEVKWGDEFIGSDDMEKEDYMGTNKRVVKTKRVFPTFYSKYLISLNYKNSVCIPFIFCAQIIH